ncbi:hypothetical protein N4Q66_26295, partial [Leclercia adecarboxylata]|uniref:hypothetical protein n=1 Tax=Leclercia adecarboxylata TaxID=83655 RepID=UPI00234D61A3
IMSNSNIDNQSATQDFVNAYDASQEVSMKAPQRTPAGIVQPKERGPYGRMRKVPGISELDALAKRSDEDDLQDYYDNVGTSFDPEDAIIAMLDGTLDEESTALLLGSDEPIEAERVDLASRLTDEEIQLVYRYGENEPASLHPM